MLGPSGSSLTNILFIENAPHRPRYARKWERRKERGDEKARGRVTKRRVFIPLALGKVISRIGGKVEETPAMNGISIPVEEEVDSGNYYALITAIGRALNRMAVLIRSKPEHERRKVLNYRTIRIETGMSVHAHTFILPDEITRLLWEIAGRAYASGSYPGNFVAERIVAAGTLQGDSGVMREFISFLRASCNVNDSTVSSLTEDEEDPNQQTEDDGEDFDLLKDEEMMEDSESGTQEENEIPHHGPGYLDGEDGDEGEDIPAHSPSGAGERDDRYERTGGELAGIAGGDVRGGQNEKSERTDHLDSGEERVQSVPDWRIPPFRAELLEKSEDEEESAESGKFSLDIPFPAPEVVLVHLVSAPLTYFSGWGIPLLFPLMVRHPALGLVGLQMLIAGMLWGLLTGDQLMDPYLSIFLYGVAFSIGVIGILITYRLAGYELSLVDGFLVLGRWIVFLAGTVIRMFSSPIPAQKVADGAAPVSAAPVASVYISRIREAREKREHQQVVDLLTAIALLTAMHPYTQFLTPALLGIALSVEAGHVNPISPAVIVGYLVRFLARDPVHHVIGVFLMVIGVPMVRAIQISHYREEIAREMEIVQAARDIVQRIGSPALLWSRLMLLIRGDGEMTEIRWRMPSNPALAALQHPELSVLSRALEEAMDIRRIIDNYIHSLQAGARKRRISRKERKIMQMEVSFWEEVQQQPLLIGIQPVRKNWVWKIPLQVVYHPAIADVVLESPHSSSSHGFSIHRDWGRRSRGPMTVQDFIASGNWVDVILQAAKEKKELAAMMRSGRLTVSPDRKLLLTSIGTITPERIDEWRNLTKEGTMPGPFPTGRGIFIPFGISTMLGGDPRIRGHRWFGIHLSPRVNSHTLIVQDTRGGKTNLQLAQILGAMQAYGDPSMPWPVGIVVIDGKSDLSTALAKARNHPAIFAPPHRFNIDEPYQTLYYFAAVFGAMNARTTLQSFLMNVASAMKEKAANEWQKLVDMSKGRLEKIWEAATGMEVIHYFIPGAAMVWIFIDELWGLITSLRDQLGTATVRLGDGGKNSVVRVRTDRLLDGAIDRLVLMGASVGMILMFASQSPRKEATDSPAIRDNANLFRGPNTLTSVVMPLLTEQMKSQQAMLMQAYQAQTGQGQVPRFVWEVYMRGSGYGALTFRDGRPELLLGRTGYGEDSYDVDCVYAPEVVSDMLPTSGDRVIIPEWSIRVLHRMVHFAREHGMYERLPPFLETLTTLNLNILNQDILNPDILNLEENSSGNSEKSSKIDPEKELKLEQAKKVMRFLREPLLIGAGPEEIYRMGKSSIVSLAQALKEVEISEDEQ